MFREECCDVIVYHKALSVALIGEISKDLMGQPVADIQKAVAAA